MVGNGYHLLLLRCSALAFNSVAIMCLDVDLFEFILLVLDVSLVFDGLLGFVDQNSSYLGGFQLLCLDPHPCLGGLHYVYVTYVSECGLPSPFHLILLRLDNFYPTIFKFADSFFLSAQCIVEYLLTAQFLCGSIFQFLCFIVNIYLMAHCLCTFKNSLNMVSFNSSDIFVIVVLKRLLRFT